MMKRRCLSMVCPLTPVLLEQWIGDSSKSFRLSAKAQVRLIAALDKNIPCWPEKHDRAGRIDDSTGKLDLDLANLARDAGGRIAVAEAYRKLIRQMPDYRRLTIGEFLRILRRVQFTVVEFKDPHIPIVRLRGSNAADSLIQVRGQDDQPSTAGKLHSRAIQLFGTKGIVCEREAIGTH
jgi:hypothetical protein